MTSSAGLEPTIDSLTREQIEAEVERILDEKLENYFRMSRPGFEIVSGQYALIHSDHQLRCENVISDIFVLCRHCLPSVVLSRHHCHHRVSLSVATVDRNRLSFEMVVSVA